MTTTGMRRALGRVMLPAGLILVLAQGVTGQAATGLDAETLMRLHETHRLAALGPGMEIEDYWVHVDDLFTSRRLPASASFGASAHQRPLFGVAFGGGPAQVLIWSQLSGEDADGANAVADLISFLATDPGHPIATEILTGLTMTALPIMNPDGVVHGQRRNAQGIELALDARRFTAPESYHLRTVIGAVQPAYAIGLEADGPDGPGGVVIRVSGSDGSPTGDRTWERSARIAAGAATASGAVTEVREIGYDARGVAQRLQSSGVTSLVVTGPARGAVRDRAARFAVLVATLYLIASEPVDDAAQPVLLGSAPPPRVAGGPRVADVLVRGAQVAAPGLPPFAAELALAYVDGPTGRQAQVLDIGDLDGAVVAGDTLNATGRFLHVSVVDMTHPLVTYPYVMVGAGTDLVVRRSEEARSAPYWLVHDGRLVRWKVYAAAKPGLYLSARPPMVSHSVRRTGAGMVDGMRVEGWADHYDQSYPALDEEPGWLAAIGYRFNPTLQVELNLHLLESGRLVGTNLAEESMVRFDYSAHSAALLVARRFRYVYLGAGPAVMTGRWSWLDEAERRRIEEAEEKPLQRPTSPRVGFTTVGGALHVAIPLPMIGDLRPEIQAQHRWFRPVMVEGFQAFPDRQVDLSSSGFGLGLTFLL